jgi:hypothetical protein
MQDPIMVFKGLCLTGPPSLRIHLLSVMTPFSAGSGEDKDRPERRKKISFCAWRDVDDGERKKGIRWKRRFA